MSFNTTQTLTENHRPMPVQKRSTYDEAGNYYTILEYDEDESKYDSVVVRFTPERDDVFFCRAYVDDEVVYEEGFQMRELSFDPISVIGRGESDKLVGSSPSDDSYEDVPQSIQIAMNALGLTVVPPGRWWLDG